MVAQKHDLTWHLLAIALLATGLKLLLIPCYRSTDFEVHRNWLAITHSLPLSQWYLDATSPWTLDYPPFFAWFEWGLSHVAAFFDPAMLKVENLEYASPATVLFQRLSVIVTDAVLILPAAALARDAVRSASGSNKGAKGLLLFALLTCNAGLLLVDHIHFQYNGVMMGVLLWSVYLMQRGQDWGAGLLYAVLLNMKHLYVYCAPLYFVYILRHWCFPPSSAAAGGSSPSVTSSAQPGKKKGKGRKGGSFLRSVGRLIIMGATVVAVCTASLGPFVKLGQVPQLASRLFPFGRGLTHAYWAGNSWALYSAADKVLSVAAPGLVKPADAVDAEVAEAGGHTAWVDSASGQVGVARLRVLPQVEPRTALGLVLLGLLPAAASLWRKPVPSRFAGAVAYAGLTGFWLGYHVHEKAVLAAILPLAVTSITSRSAAQDFVVLSCAGTYGLLPLLYEAQEYPIKLLLALMYHILAAGGLAYIHGSAKQAGSGSKGKQQQQQQPSPVTGSAQTGQGSGQQQGNQQLSKATGAQAVAGGRTQASKTQGRHQQADSVLTLPSKWAGAGDLLNPLAALYCLGFLPLELYCSFVHQAVLGERLPFLPLMLTSLYCAAGIGGVWVHMLGSYLLGTGTY